MGVRRELKRHPVDVEPASRDAAVDQVEVGVEDCPFVAVNMDEDASRNTENKDDHQEEEQQTDAKRDLAVGAIQAAREFHQAKEINSKELVEEQIMAKKANPKSEARSQRRNQEGVGSSRQASVGDLAEIMNEDASRNTANKEEHQEEEQQQTDAKREGAVSASQSVGQSQDEDSGRGGFFMAGLCGGFSRKHE